MENSQKSKELLVFENATQSENIVKINPNDGLDIGIIQLNKDVKIVSNLTNDDRKTYELVSDNGSILIDNNRKSGTVEISFKLWKKINKPKTITLVLQNENLFIL